MRRDDGVSADDDDDSDEDDDSDDDEDDVKMNLNRLCIFRFQDIRYHRVLFDQCKDR